MHAWCLHQFTDAWQSLLSGTLSLFVTNHFFTNTLQNSYRTPSVSRVFLKYCKPTKGYITFTQHIPNENVYSFPSTAHIILKRPHCSFIFMAMITLIPETIYGLTLISAYNIFCIHECNMHLHIVTFIGGQESTDSEVSWSCWGPNQQIRSSI